MQFMPGDIILMKLDAFQGKRKAKDRWSEVEYVVAHLVTNDMPAYMVKDDGENVKVAHHNRLFLVTPARNASTPLGESESISYVGTIRSTLAEITLWSVVEKHQKVKSRGADPEPCQSCSTWVVGWHFTATTISGPETNSMQVKIW